MTDYPGSGNYTPKVGTKSYYRLDIVARTTNVSGGTKVEIYAAPIMTSNPGTPAFGTGTRSWSLTGAYSDAGFTTKDASGNSSFPYNFSNSNPVVAYNYFNRYVPYSQGASTTLSVTVAGSGSNFFTSRTVSITVPLTTAPVPTTFAIPNLIGKTYTEAESTWDGSTNPDWTGTFTATSGNTTSLESNNNRVYSQSPTAGSMQAASSPMTVNYYVYVKPIIMPNLNDRTEENATSALTTSGFTSTPTITRTTVGATSDNVGKVVKDSQSPAALTSTTATQAISFSVYQLPGKRILGSAGNHTELTHAKRYAAATETESSGWKNITTFKRYNGTSWVDITN